MGGKAEPDVIRSGCEEAGVSAVISVKKNNAEVAEWLKTRDIECEEIRLSYAGASKLLAEVLSIYRMFP